jgi:hypothetical protein
MCIANYDSGQALLHGSEFLVPRYRLYWVGVRGHGYGLWVWDENNQGLH